MLYAMRFFTTILFTLTALTLAGCDAIHVRADSTDGPMQVEAAAFEGGYGIAWHQKMAENYSAETEGVEVTLWGDPRVADKLKPRLLRGDPPAFILDNKIPLWMLIGAEKLRPLDDLLDAPAHGADQNWRDCFIPGTLDSYTSDGQVYAVPTAFGAYTCWYDARQFREQGWEPPKTWDEMLVLCEKMQAAGVAPFAFQGKYPLYAFWTLNTIIHRCGGLAAINRLNALEPGAFTHPDVVQAAALMQELAVKYFQKGAMAMNHTESQLQFVNNKAAMIFCGLWLDNEMKASIPEGFEMACFNIPPVDGGKGNPKLFNGAGWEYAFITKDGENSDEAANFLRYMISPTNAPDMGRSIGVISPLKGSTPRDALRPALQSALDMIEASDGIFNLRLDSLLLNWRIQVMQPSMAKLLRGEVTPEEFCQIMEDGLEDARNNPDIMIPTPVLLDPAKFGETS